MDCSDSEELENDTPCQVSDESRSSSPEGWVEDKYKKFNACESDSSDDDSDSESESQQVKGTNISGDKKKYKKLLEIEELLPE